MMTLNRDQERVLALAGIVQAAALIYEMVMENKLDENTFAICIEIMYQQPKLSNIRYVK